MTFVGTTRGILRGLRRLGEDGKKESQDVQRWSIQTKCALRSLEAVWTERARDGAHIDLSTTGLRVFSQFEEDGLILAVFAAIGTTNRLFVDIGAADGINSNCANLAVNLGWHGMFIDGSHEQVNSGRAWYASHPDTFLFPPVFVEGMVTRDNVNDLIQAGGFAGDIDFLSIDIDGNDYWIWEALEAVNARVVMVESNAAFGDQPIVAKYDPNFIYTGQDQYFGAGAEAFRRLAERKTYRLVGANRFGFNTIFVKRGIGEQVLPTVSLESIRRHPRNRELEKSFEPIRHRPFVSIPSLEGEHSSTSIATERPATQR
jgi:hypothetical protein